MMRVAVARAVSIAGHPVVLLLVAALIAASTRGASLRQLWLISGALVTLGVVARLDSVGCRYGPVGGHILTRAFGMSAVR